MNSNIKIAIVASRFNGDITHRLLKGAMERLAELGVEEGNFTVSWVPGAVEIPLAARQFARHQEYDAVICLGAVIRGETDHYEYVCRQVSDGCQRVALDCDLPIIFGVLTTKNEEQALARAGGAQGHKGRDAAEAAVEMVHFMRQNNPCTCKEGMLIRCKSG